jgi:protease-4
VLQVSVDHAYRVFVGNVAAAREKSFDDIDAVAQGRVWAGIDAAKLGLVDKLGTYRQALDAAAARAGLGKEYRIEYIEPPLGWRAALAMQSQALAARFTRALLPEQKFLAEARRVLAPFETELSQLAHFADSRQVYYYCACPVH